MKTKKITTKKIRAGEARGALFLLGCILLISLLAAEEVAWSSSYQKLEEDFTTSLVFKENIFSKVYFRDSPEGKHIRDIHESDASTFTVVVEAGNGSQFEIDTMQVVLTTESGDQDIFRVIETGKSTGKYESEEISFGFVSRVEPGNQIVEGVIDYTSTDNMLNVYAMAITSKNTVYSNLRISSAYVPVDSAWIIDGNSDGQADFIVISFQLSLPRLPNEVFSIDWPVEGSNGYAALYNSDSELSEISFLPTGNGTFDSSVVLVMLENEDFAMGDTKISEIHPASLTLPDNLIFRWQAPKISDRVGPILVQATRYPPITKKFEKVNLTNDAATAEPDTFLITFSEKIYPMAGVEFPWDSLLQYVPNGTNKALPIISLEQPTPVNQDSLTWKFVTFAGKTRDRPDNGDEVSVSPSAPFTDKAGNSPGEHWDMMEGLDRTSAIFKSPLWHEAKTQDNSVRIAAGH